MKKINTIRKFITVISLVLAMATLLSVNTFAAMPEDNTVQPLWDSILDMEVLITYDGTNGNATGVSTRQSTASSIEGTVTVYKEVDGDWEFVDSAYNSRTGRTLAVEVNFTAEPGATYKAEFTVTAYTNNVPETETIEYTETCPKS